MSNPQVELKQSIHHEKLNTEGKIMPDIQTIELDCEPGSLRPGDLIEDVIKDTGLPTREPCSKFFGNWVWDYTDIPADEWVKAKKFTGPKIEVLYHDGAIRYGSW